MSEAKYRLLRVDEITEGIDRLSLNLKELSTALEGSQSLSSTVNLFLPRGDPFPNARRHLEIALRIRSRMGFEGAISTLLHGTSDAALYLSKLNGKPDKIASIKVKMSTHHFSTIEQIAGVSLILLNNPTRGTPEYRDRIADCWLSRDPLSSFPTPIEVSRSLADDVESGLDTLEMLLKKKTTKSFHNSNFYAGHGKNSTDLPEQPFK